MNYGRFFKLNQNLSDMVAGVTIFDYTELSVYEGLASDNTPSPKYPISMTITDNAVRFKMHYCIYRCSDANKDNPNPVYGFSIDDIKRQLYSAHPSGSDEQYKQSHNIVHIEEVILELPFTGFRTNELTETIKKSYIASFPQIYEKYESEVSDHILTGNRFLDQLIEKELSGHNLDSDAISYSTLWLMDLYDNDGNINLQSKGKDDLIDKFLRKLLLDFMFDLNHSDLFQVSPKYDQMYSGLMSNYYFSALMHKCEYYYYRDITFKAIKVYKENRSKIKQLNEPTTEKNKLIKTEKDRIIHLYAKELFEAEEQWANDIRNPLSEDYFEPDFPDDFSRAGKTQWGRWCTEICSMFGERMTSTCWNSWFSNSEEEMRRIYFPYKSYNFCNSVSLIERFHLFFDKSEVAQSMMLLAQKSRGKSSRWFLNRYDFNDVLHLHLFKHCNLLFILVILAFFVNLFFFKENVKMFSQIAVKYLPFLLLISSLFIAICQWLNIVDKHEKKRDIIYYRFVIKKFWVVAATFTFFLFLFMLLSRKFKLPYDCWSLSYILYWIIGLVSFIVLALATIIPLFKWPKLYAMNVTFHPIKSLHLFFPKVIASIITAWLTLSVPTFRNSICSLNTNIFIVIIFVVLFFFLYLIDQVCSAHNNLTKVLRAFEFLIISYGLSLAVGYIIIILGASNNDMNNLYKSSAMALFIGLFLRMIFRSQKQMTDI